MARPHASGVLPRTASPPTTSAAVEARRSSVVRRAPGRPRSERCHQAILDATADLLDERRYADVSIESIAERAGVVKATIYKWWSCKALLAMEAYAARTGERIPAPDTGTVERDMQLMLRRTCRVLSDGNIGQTVAGLIAEAQSDPKLAEPFRTTFIGSRRERMITILHRGIERGELREDLDVSATIDLLYGPLWYRLLLRHAPLSPSFADAVVQSVLPGIRHPEARLPPPAVRLSPRPPAEKTPTRTRKSAR
jgi:AcrR family transcriptional regulator